MKLKLLLALVLLSSSAIAIEDAHPYDAPAFIRQQDGSITFGIAHLNHDLHIDGMLFMCLGVATKPDILTCYAVRDDGTVNEFVLNKSVKST